MKIIESAKYCWHTFWSSYNIVMYESCIDEGMRRKLKKKFHYHNQKLVQLSWRMI
ncbi:hypothetical protein FHS15_003347 [Paenibacillus castaneae]|uniref:hypothetical protein n=1 Tax=Paenibacillus castaneae TaxID=474957 RepID=UPI00141AA8D2|nr:hypothetical protein [Paenibacillus castaneae]NIK78209.1 hypothetical protein [Paenibacillus castaneae]